MRGNGAQERRGSGRGMGGNGRGDRPPLPPLDWQTVDTLENGDLHLEVRQAALSDGRGYRTSFSVGRKTRNDRTTKWFRSSDATDLIQLLEDYKAWMESRVR